MSGSVPPRPERDGPLAQRSGPGAVGCDRVLQLPSQSRRQPGLEIEVHALHSGQRVLEIPHHLVAAHGEAGAQVGEGERDLGPQVDEALGGGEGARRTQPGAGLLDRAGAGEGVGLGEEDGRVLAWVDGSR